MTDYKNIKELQVAKEKKISKTNDWEGLRYIRK